MLMTHLTLHQNDICQLNEKFIRIKTNQYGKFFLKNPVKKLNVIYTWINYDVISFQNVETNL